MSKIDNKGSVLDKLVSRITPAELKKTRDRMRLASTISDLLAERNMSKSQFAKFMGKEPSVITRWLSGTHNFTIDTLSEISECLGYPLAKFFEEKEPELVYKSKFAITSYHDNSELNKLRTALLKPFADVSCYRILGHLSSQSRISLTDEQKNWTLVSLDFKTDGHAVSADRISDSLYDQKV